MIYKLIKWVKNNQTEFFIILGLLVISAFLRFYRISEYMTFLGDEGRDALMIKRILETFDIPLLGPVTSIGNMYLGPLYYYMMAIPMAIFWLNPVAAAGMVAVIGTATVGLVYYLSREWFGKISAIVAAALYSLSPVNIIYSRSSWNPNPAPFFALLAILGMYKAHTKKNWRWLILSGVACAFAVQMHYLALILVPVIGVLWVFEIFRNKFWNKPFAKANKNFWISTIGAILVFLVLMSPLAVFDLKHNYMNFNAIKTFFSNRQETVNLNPLNTTARIVPIFSESLVGRYITGENKTLQFAVPVLILLPVIFFIWQTFKVRKNFYWPFFALGVWIVIGVLGLVLYKRTIFDHYLGFLNPAPFILFGSLGYLAQKTKIKKPLLWGFVGLGFILAFVSIQRSPLKDSPHYQLQRAQKVAKYVIEQAGGKPYNFALIAEHNYDDAYEFYLDVYKHPSAQLPFVKTDQLFVVCEDKVCNPIGHPKQEISHFGWAKIEYEKEFEGVKVFKLVHNPDEQRQEQN